MIRPENETVEWLDNRAESWYGVLPIRDVVGRVLF